jgi:hypothetical protein
VPGSDGGGEGDNDEEETMLDHDVPTRSSSNRSSSLNERTLSEIKATYQLCLEACARDASLLSFLMQETTRAVERNKLHPRVVRVFILFFNFVFQLIAMVCALQLEQ